MEFNYSECIKEYDEWGSTTYTNICTKEETTIPWGVSGYLGFSGIIILFMLGIVCILLMIRMIFDF